MYTFTLSVFATVACCSIRVETEWTNAPPLLWSNQPHGRKGVSPFQVPCPRAAGCAAGLTAPEGPIAPRLVERPTDSLLSVPIFSGCLCSLSLWMAGPLAARQEGEAQCLCRPNAHGLPSSGAPKAVGASTQPSTSLNEPAPPLRVVFAGDSHFHASIHPNFCVPPSFSWLVRVPSEKDRDQKWTAHMPFIADGSPIALPLLPHPTHPMLAMGSLWNQWAEVQPLLW